MSSSFLNVPIEFLNKDALNDKALEVRLTDLVRTGLEEVSDPKANYGKVKFEAVTNNEGGIEKLVAYITHKDIYFFETVELLMDPSGSVKEIRKM